MLKMALASQGTEAAVSLHAETEMGGRLFPPLGCAPGLGYSQGGEGRVAHSPQAPCEGSDLQQALLPQQGPGTLQVRPQLSSSDPEVGPVPEWAGWGHAMSPPCGCWAPP